MKYQRLRDLREDKDLTQTEYYSQIDFINLRIRVLRTLMPRKARHAVS